MIRDPIVDEVRQHRLKTEEACDHDWEKLAEHYRQVKTDIGQLVQGEPRRIAPDSDSFDGT